MHRIYVCGPTLYNSAHIGNLRPIITFDIYAKVWKICNYEKIHLTHNITDIDDKIIAKSIKQKVSEDVVTTKYLKEYNQLIKTLNINSINEKPLVTKNINEIINFIKKLITLDVTYEVEGNLFFNISKIKSYGKISHQNTDRLINNEYNKLKKNQNDFLLWKKTKMGKAYSSPWGKGRPGWHTECVSLINSIYQGKSLDIHSGGIDLIFPHHENEAVQFMAIYHKPLAKKWIHIGQINLKNMKMSKSLNNIINAKTFIKIYGSDTLRMLFLSSNISKPLDVKKKFIENIQKNLEKIKKNYFKAKLMNAKKKVCKKKLRLILNWKFAEFNKYLFSIIKKFNNSNDLKIGGKIIYLVDAIGFVFTKIKISKQDKYNYYYWIKYRKIKNYKKADFFKQFLFKKTNLGIFKDGHMRK